VLITLYPPGVDELVRKKLSKIVGKTVSKITGEIVRLCIFEVGS
jgi:hypothetical protein